MSKKAVLIIMDGFGLAPAGPGNAITNAKTPRMSDALCTMTYLAEWYDAVALEIDTLGRQEQIVVCG